MLCRLLHKTGGCENASRYLRFFQIHVEQIGLHFLKASVKGPDVVTAWHLIFLPWKDEGLRWPWSFKESTAVISNLTLRSITKSFPLAELTHCLFAHHEKKKKARSFNAPLVLQSHSCVKPFLHNMLSRHIAAKLSSIEAACNLINYSRSSRIN